MRLFATQISWYQFIISGCWEGGWTNPIRVNIESVSTLHTQLPHILHERDTTAKLASK